MALSRTNSSVVSKMAVCLFLFFLHFLSSAHAAIIPSPPSTPSFFNLTLANQINLNGSTVGQFWNSYCTPIRRWNQPRMQQDDCQAVLQYFYHETMADGGKKPIEFRSPGATRTTHMKVQKTPRKYTFGKRPETSILTSHVRLVNTRSLLTRLTPPTPARHMYDSDHHSRRLSHPGNAARRLQKWTADRFVHLSRSEPRSSESCRRLCLRQVRGGVAANRPAQRHRSVCVVYEFGGGQRN